MSLRPVKGRGSRGRRRYSQLKSQRSYKGWEGWNWKAVKKSPMWTREFYKHKKGIALIVLLSLVTLFTVDQALKNPMSGTSPIDPLKPLWGETLSQNNLSSFSCQFAFQAPSFRNNAFGSNGFPGENLKGVALSITNFAGLPFGSVCIDQTSMDLSTGAAKVIDLWHNWGWNNSVSGTFPPSLYFFLTRNNTAPTQIGDYNPNIDRNVALIVLTIINPSGANTLETFTYMQHDPTRSISDDDHGCANSAGSVFFCGTAETITPQGWQISTTASYGNLFQLNYTGSSASSSPSSLSNFNYGPGANGGTGGCIATCKIYSLPWFNLQSQKYYWGVGVRGATSACPCNNPVFEAAFDPQVVGNEAVPTASGGMEVEQYTPPPISLALDTGGFFGPIIKALISLGVFMLNALLQFIGFITPGLQTALVYLESIFVTTLDLIGSAFGFPNLGSDLASIISNIISFFVSYLPTIFLQFPTLFSDFLTNLNVLFPWIPIAVSIALNLSTLFLNSIIFAIKLVTLSFTLISGIFVIVLFAFYFIYTGDDALGGLLAFLEFTEYLAVNIGVGFTFKVLNWGLDIFLFLVGLIPKPIIQVSIAKIPRLPTIESNARFVPPSFDLGELRAGNMFAVWEWFMGFYFLGWYQQVTPALPGSLGALLPATASHLTPITGMLPLLQICLIIISGLTFLVWPMMKMFSLIGLDIGLQDAFGIGPGRKISAGPSGIRIAKGSKHLQGRVQKKIGGRATEKKKIETAGLAFAEAARKNQVEIEGKNARETGERIIREELAKRRKAPLEGGAA